MNDNSFINKLGSYRPPEDFIIKACWLIIICGIILRLFQFFVNDSLWLDEIFLGLNLIDRSYLELFHPLNYEQYAPIGFLLLEKLMGQLFGYTEYSLRILPLISGLVAIYLFYRLTKGTFNYFITTVALFLFCFSRYLINYSMEVKPYSFDVLIAVSILLLALYIYKEGLTKKNALYLCLLGSISIWFSFVSIFMLAAVGISFLIYYYRMKNRDFLYNITIIGTIWVVLFAINYYFFLRHSSPDVTYFWYKFNGFLQLPCSFYELLVQCIIKFYSLLDLLILSMDNTTIFGFFGLLVTALFFAGYVSLLVEKEWFISWLFFLPVLLTFVASLLFIYPFKSRLILFLLPVVIILTAKGLGFLRD